MRKKNQIAVVVILLIAVGFFVSYRIGSYAGYIRGSADVASGLSFQCLQELDQH